MPSPIQMTRTSPTRVLDAKLFDRVMNAQHRASLVPSRCFLHRKLAEQMMDRRSFVKRETPVVLEVGAHSGWFLREMVRQKKFFGCKQYIQTDTSEEALNRIYNDVKDELPAGMEFVQICCDEEEPGALGIPSRSVDMAVSNLSLHWANELEPTLINIRNALKRDAFLLASILGGNTLYELRSAFTLTDLEVRGGVSPHVSPMLDGAGVSELVMQSGFALPNIDMDRYVLSYESPFHLMEHLRDMGETACHLQRTAFLGRSSLTAMASVYERLYAKDGLCPATFEVFHTIAWSPSPTQPKPLERGSAQVSLTQVTTTLHREFQQALVDSSKKPDDVELQRKAEELYARLQEAMKEEQEGRGMETDIDKQLAASKSKHKQPAPPERNR
uniref:Methyltransferase type 11 domain-containing protein n=1 Tax=Neobodo designis TaxID=312471 RepID=A0A7S1MIG7_NEODS|mmetsp:Transcript_41288/g.127556  ORF Transcript_41288/g.127556 Transcript_41288/m.127556 type:complete len:387 (+) Transcript_41288:122-1282(+)